MNIREYQPSDYEAVKECLIELQEVERRFHPRLAEGQAIAAEYMEILFKKGQTEAGQIFVAEVDSNVVGCVAVQAKVQMTEMDETPYDYAYISDLAVLKAHRGQGLGRILMQRAETYAKEQGADLLRLSVLAKNNVARRLHEKQGFEEHMIEMEKKL